MDKKSRPKTLGNANSVTFRPKGQSATPSETAKKLTAARTENPPFEVYRHILTGKPLFRPRRPKFGKRSDD